MALALRTERTEARLLPEQKKRIARAARLKGLSLSDFMVQHADEAAKKTILEHTSWVLGDRDRDVFVQALLNPPRPSAPMKEAARRYKEHTATRNARVDLTPELDSFVLARVESGRFENASEVVRAALRTLEREERLYETKLEALRAAIDDGDASGVVEGDVFAQVRKALKLTTKSR